MVKSFDVGSLPFSGDFQKFLERTTAYSQTQGSVNYFERKVVDSFLDKVRAGIDVPNYPQFRDMNEMFLDLIDGVEKVKGGYIEKEVLSVQAEKTRIPEVVAIKNNSRDIFDKINQPFKIKISITGPYTLSCLFVHKDGRIFNRLGKIISRIVENNIFNGKTGSVILVSVDEPTFGMIDDPLIDYGTEGRENLLRAWEAIFHKATSRGTHTCLHLHDTTDDLFWEIKSLNIVESHMEDFIYQSKKTKKRLESTDKFLKASICISDFNKLIIENITASLQQKTLESTINEKVAETWKNIKTGKLDPKIFLENKELMKERLIEIVNRFGVERVPYAGPECGLKSFPTYKCALECLHDAAIAVKTHKTRIP